MSKTQNNHTLGQDTLFVVTLVVNHFERVKISSNSLIFSQGGTGITSLGPHRSIEGNSGIFFIIPSPNSRLSSLKSQLLPDTTVPGSLFPPGELSLGSGDITPSYYHSDIRGDNGILMFCYSPLSPVFIIFWSFPFTEFCFFVEGIRRFSDWSLWNVHKKILYRLLDGWEVSWLDSIPHSQTSFYCSSNTSFFTVVGSHPRWRWHVPSWWMNIEYLFLLSF